MEEVDAEFEEFRVIIKKLWDKEPVTEEEFEKYRSFADSIQEE